MHPRHLYLHTLIHGFVELLPSLCGLCAHCTCTKNNPFFYTRPLIKLGHDVIITDRIYILIYSLLSLSRSVLFLVVSTMAGIFQLLLLLIVGVVLTQAAIFKRESSKTQRVRTEVHVPVQDIYKELGRLRRSAGAPSHHKMPLNDSHIYGNIQYSGNDSGVSFLI